MPRALLVGDFGRPEPGAQALLEVFARSLPSRWTPVVTSENPVSTERRHGVEAVRPPSTREVSRQVRSVDALVVAGGSPLDSVTVRPGGSGADRMRIIGPLSIASRLLSKPVAAVGVGADTLPSRASRALARGLVRRADLLVLRDEESAESLATAGASAPFRVGSDPTWALLDRPLSPVTQASDTVTVVVQQTDGPLDADFLAVGLHPVERGGLRVRIQPWLATGNAGDDVSLARHLADRLDNAVVLESPGSLVEARDSLAESRVVLGMHFHALLAAASAGSRFVALSATPGPRGLAHRFEQPALGPDSAPERLAEAVLAAAAGPRPNPATVRSEIASAEEGFRLLRLLLNGGAGDDVDEITGLPLRPVPWAQ